MEDLKGISIAVTKDVKRGLRMLASKMDKPLKHYIHDVLKKHVDDNVKNGNIKL